LSGFDRRAADTEQDLTAEDTDPKANNQQCQPTRTDDKALRARIYSHRKRRPLPTHRPHNRPQQNKTRRHQRPKRRSVIVNDYSRKDGQDPVDELVRGRDHAVLCVGDAGDFFTDGALEGGEGGLGVVATHYNAWRGRV
jgi:hypothetical protein